MNIDQSQSHIRNFAIIAHIDHGKSTLADRLLELTGTIQKRDMQEQVLDSNPIERERGITIKLAPVRMRYRMPNDKCQMTNEGKKTFSIGHLALDIANSAYTLNLIDTPGHVDFGYEVSRSLAACEGALLVVDATQGVQAQTLANLHQARAHKLTIIPIINKIDLPNARILETQAELETLGFRDEEIMRISAKTGENVEKVLEAIVDRIPSPSGNPDAPLRALVFSSQYDIHKGVIVFVRIVDGSIHTFKGGTLQGVYSNTKHDDEVHEGSTMQDRVDSLRIRFMASGAQVAPIELGYFTPAMSSKPGLEAGEVGYIATGLKDIRFAKVGDTITTIQNSKFKIQNEKFKVESFNFKVTSLPGYKEPKPMVFLGLFPIESDQIAEAREAMERLRLSDSAFTFRPINSLALGNGFHCGFLGLLHAEIVQERLLREFDLSMIATSPSVEYRISLKGSHLFRLKGETLRVIQSASEFPDSGTIDEVREPVMRVTVYAPSRFVGAIMQLCQEKRGDYVDLKYMGIHSDEVPTRTSEASSGLGQVEITYLLPLSEMIVDFFDALKSITEGYASLDYEFYEHRAVGVAKVDILVNKEKVDALSFLVVEGQAHRRGKTIVERLADVIPRQQFAIPIQAAIGGQIVARADVKPFRKDVIQKLYGGDRTRKDKLLDKQKKGKAKMKMVGRVEIPQQAFFHVLNRD